MKMKLCFLFVLLTFYGCKDEIIVQPEIQTLNEVQNPITIKYSFTSGLHDIYTIENVSQIKLDSCGVKCWHIYNGIVDTDTIDYYVGTMYPSDIFVFDVPWTFNTRVSPYWKK